MGVRDLWPILLPAVDALSISHLSTVEGFERNPSGLRALRVGVDASLWLYHSFASKKGHNSALRMLFYRSARLFQHPFLLVFVFDGPHRPKRKRDKDTISRHTTLMKQFKELIEAFGFKWLNAPGEAEAELAHMQHSGVIDVVMSDDIDTLLFGCTRMILNPGGRGNRNHSCHRIIDAEPNKTHETHLIVVSSDTFQQRGLTGLRRGGMILIALMRGGDYDTSGIRGCGIRAAYGLAKCGYGDELVDAAMTMDDLSLTAFIPAWKQRLRHELITNSSGLLPCKYPSVARSTSFASFPNREVLTYYIRPATSMTYPAFSYNLRWDQGPDIGRLASLCQTHFRWPPCDVLRKFRSSIWRGLALRVLLQENIRLDKTRSPISSAVTSLPHLVANGSSAITEEARSPHTYSLPGVWAEGSTLFRGITDVRTNHSSTDLACEYLVVISPSPLVELAFAGLVKTNSQDFTDAGDTLSVWIPQSLLESVRPDWIIHYMYKHPTFIGRNAKKIKQLKIDSFFAGQKRVSESPTSAQATMRAVNPYMHGPLTSGECRTSKRQRT